MIHPTAIIHDDAIIGQDVEIGPYSIVGPEVTIGEGTWVGPHVVINGPTVIGKNNKIYQFSSIGEIPQHAHHDDTTTRLVIGDNNVIREYCTFNRGTVMDRHETTIGNNNYFMAYVHIAHDCIVKNHTIFANCASLAGHVVVDDYAIFGGFSGIHQFCKIGAHVMTGISTISFKDIPPFLMVSGNTAKPYGLNIRGLKRRGFTEDTIQAIRKAYKIIYRSGLKLSDALDELEPLSTEFKEVEYFRSFIQSSERGIIR